MRSRESLQAIRDDHSQPADQRARQIIRHRSDAVVKAFTKSRDEHGLPVVSLGVSFQDIRPIFHEDGDVIGVEIFTSPHATEAHYRIFNPPTLVRDPSGDIHVQDKHHREDPLAAVAQVIRDNRKAQR